MKSLFNKLLMIKGQKFTNTDKLFKQKTRYNVKILPKEAIQQIKKLKSQKFLNKINQVEPQALIYIRKLCVMHYIIMHSSDIILKIPCLVVENCHTDIWLFENIIKKYKLFLNKILSSYQMYKKISKNQIKFQQCFYLINLLNDLLSCSKKVSNFGRYYYKQQSNLDINCIQNYVFTLSYQAMIIYECLIKIILQKIGKFSQLLDCQKKILKQIVNKQIPVINQQMKQLFLDKYFFPYGKGFIVKLFNAQKFKDLEKYDNFIQYMMDQTNQNRENIKRIKKTNRIQDLIYDSQGRITKQFYNSLIKIRKGDNSYFNKLIQQKMPTCNQIRFQNEINYQKVQDI